MIHKHKIDAIFLFTLYLKSRIVHNQLLNGLIVIETTNAINRYIINNCILVNKKRKNPRSIRKIIFCIGLFILLDS